MKIWTAIPILAVCWTAACSTNPHFMTPKVTADLNETNLGFPVRKVRAGTIWSSSYGHGLKVEVWSTRKPADYARDFRLEESGAAKVCSVLAKNNAATSWDFLEVACVVEYGKAPPESRNLAGAVNAIIKCDTLRILGESNAPATDYPPQWKFRLGFKDQPDSRELLKW